MAHPAILMRVVDDKNNETINELVKEYEGTPLLGPNQLILSQSLNSIFFTDSGPFGETTIDNSKGSVYVIDLEGQVIKPLAFNCLAYPSGLVLSNDDKVLYVCETCRNRVLRFVLTNEGVFYQSVFYQFSGRYGPTAITIS